MIDNLKGWQKGLIVVVCFLIAIVGFMIKLPRVFRHIDKELHASFYFVAAAFLNILFGKKNLLRHLIIFLLLFGFGVAIEYAQAYSNKFFRVRIHGRFDIEDVQWNLTGLVLYSLIWLVYVAISYLSRKR